MASQGEAPGSGARALRRMRAYITWSLVSVIVVLGLLVALVVAADPATRLLAVLVVASTGLVTWQTVHWERGAPIPVAAASVAVGLALWILALVFGAPYGALGLIAATGYVVTTADRHGAGWVALGFVPIGLPPLVVAVGFGQAWAWFALAACALGYASFVFALRLNLWAWGLSLELDAARAAAADLAVLEERYRFAADLHDIQGQALHVSRLQVQLADRLVDRDPSRARAALREADRQLGQAIADTRSLATGDRRVTLPAELANARRLVEAAGIRFEVRGEPPAAADELAAITVREATTNILRHAEATEVVVTFTGADLRIENDGVRGERRELRGLARLGERIAAAGGTLRTEQSAGRFVTEARR